MEEFERCTIDAHVAELMNLPRPALGGVRAYQDARVRACFSYVKKHSPFYRELYRDIPALEGLMDLARLPLLRDADIRAQGTRMLCVPQEQICRIYTTGGSTGAPKRLYFTEEELEQTVAYFRAGIPMFLRPGDRALIFLPCRQENSVGRLFGKSVKRLGAVPIYYGLPEDLGDAWKVLTNCRANLLLAAPATALALLEGYAPLPRLDTLLLSSDALRPEARTRLAAAFRCKVFEQYGLTETCFGAGVDCAAGRGYHLREADFFFEIVDEVGRHVPDGEYGEVVFTTLRRKAMPLIRYATGDISRFLPEPCPCGSMLPLLDRVRPRPTQKQYNPQE